MDVDREAFFWQMRDGKLPAPRVAATLGMVITKVSAEDGVVEADFEGKPEFTNPVGNVQGGILAAMLDDTMGPALACQLRAGEFAPTLNLNISFLKPAKPGKLRLEEPEGVREVERHVGVSYSRLKGVTHNVINANAYEFRFVEIELK